MRVNSVSYGQLKDVWTIPATSTQGKQRRRQRLYCACLTVSRFRFGLTQKIFLEFVKYVKQQLENSI
jgi:hypothetical protein